MTTVDSDIMNITGDSLNKAMSNDWEKSLYYCSSVPTNPNTSIRNASPSLYIAEVEGDEQSYF